QQTRHLANGLILRAASSTALQSNRDELCHLIEKTGQSAVAESARRDESDRHVRERLAGAGAQHAPFDRALIRILSERAEQQHQREKLQFHDSVSPVLPF